MVKKPITLKEARITRALDRFISEHETDPPGDMDKLDAVISRPLSEMTNQLRKHLLRILTRIETVLKFLGVLVQMLTRNVNVSSANAGFQT